MAEMRFCMYCREERPKEGFVVMLDHRSGTRRGMCAPCLQTRKLQKEERERLAALATEKRKEKI